MLTKNDLLQIQKIVQQAVEPLATKAELKIVEKKLQRQGRETHKKINLVAGFFDKELGEIRKEIKAIKTNLN